MSHEHSEQSIPIQHIEIPTDIRIQSSSTSVSLSFARNITLNNLIPGNQYTSKLYVASNIQSPDTPSIEPSSFSFTASSSSERLAFIVQINPEDLVLITSETHDLTLNKKNTESFFLKCDNKNLCPTFQITNTPTATRTLTPTATATLTPTPSITMTSTVTPTITPSKHCNNTICPQNFIFDPESCVCVPEPTTTVLPPDIPPPINCDPSAGPIIINGYAYYFNSITTINIPGIGNLTSPCAGGHACDRTNFIPQLRIGETVIAAANPISLNNLPNGGNVSDFFTFEIPDRTLLNNAIGLNLLCYDSNCHNGVTWIILTANVEESTVLLFNSCVLPNSLTPLSYKCQGTATPTPTPTLTPTLTTTPTVTPTSTSLSSKSYYGWGNNNFGSLGDNITTDRTIPTKIGNIAWKQIKTGIRTTLAIHPDETLWAWGDNSYGQLGDGTKISTNYPINISSSQWNMISSGFGFSLAIQKNNTLWAWGRNVFGQLGDNSAPPPNTQPNARDITTPLQIGSDSWYSISGGGEHSLGIKSNGTLWSWGYNAFGQLGDGTTTVRRSPVQIGSFNDWVYVSAGDYHSCAIRSDGSLWLWGINYDGQLGLGFYTDPMEQGVLIPTQISGSWMYVSGGYNHTVAIKSDGSLWSWGLNDYGQLGDGSIIRKNTPTLISNEQWKKIDASDHTLAIKYDDSLWAFGYNGQGQLGDGTKINRNMPIQVNNNIWYNISCGQNQSVGIASP